MKTHTYRTLARWSGSTGVGYAAYDRSHEVTPLGRLSADPAFLGDAALPNPEVLLLAAASSCQLLSFLAVAARARIDVIRYVDEAEALMPEDDLPVRVTRIVLRPRITVLAEAAALRVPHLVEVAHGECFIARSLTTRIEVRPTVEVAERGPLDPDGVLDRFLAGGRIAVMPTKRRKRLVVLDWVAQRFEPGRTYTEPEVDALLKQVYDDHAALRRYLVEEDLMSRDGGVYRRSGGTVIL